MRSYFAYYVFSILFAATVAAPLSAESTQSQNSNSSAQNTQNATSSNSTQDSQSATSSKDNAANQTIEGCIVKRQTAYYIQPRSGEQTRLSGGDQDLSSHVGQDVRLSGNMNQSNTQGSSSQNSSQASTQSGTQNSSAGSQDIFDVTRVDVVAAQCPADIQKQIDQQNSNGSNPK